MAILKRTTRRTRAILALALAVTLALATTLALAATAVLASPKLLDWQKILPKAIQSASFSATTLLKITSAAPSKTSRSKNVAPRSC